MIGTEMRFLVVIRHLVLPVKHPLATTGMWTVHLPTGLAGEFYHSFVDDNGTPITKPFDEIDNDGDNYVECDAFDPVAWAAAGGSFSVLGGNDCYDNDEWVFPGATEYCDGQFNDCDALAYNPDAVRARWSSTCR